MAIVFTGGTGVSQNKLIFVRDNATNQPNTTDAKKSYETNYNFINNELNTVRQNLNISTGYSSVELDKNIRSRFNRFLIPFPDTQLTKTFAHVFFTRPDLNLFTDFTQVGLNESVGNDPIFYHIFNSDPEILKLLTADYTSNHMFNPYLSNLAKTFELKDDLLETVDTGETFTGYKLRYGRHNIRNKTADSISIRFNEDNNYGVYKIHKAWTDYISKVYRGYFSPKRKYIEDRIIDYACSIYYFVCGPDGETVLFWSKYTGVFPISAPSSYSSWSYGDIGKILEYSVEYQYAWKEDYNPIHIAEFNIQSLRNRLNTSKISRQYLKTYEPLNVGTGRTFSACPFIQQYQTADNKTGYKLRFEPISASDGRR